VRRATLAFSCANGFYALRAAQQAPERVSNLVLSQTPSLSAMHRWVDHIIPKPLRVPVVGQIGARVFRRKAARDWYRTAVPNTLQREAFKETSLRALQGGACFCLAGVVQGLSREKEIFLNGVKTPCTMIWGMKDLSHRHTDPLSLQECVPHVQIVRFEECGHFPELEQAERFAAILSDSVALYA
jgi:pimeloyl-ACP methyl ester carboxylesterase